MALIEGFYYKDEIFVSSNASFGKITVEESDYFMQIVFGNDSSNTIKKWDKNIKIKVYGNPTSEDIIVLNNTINSINGVIPNIKVFMDENNPNTEIYFVSAQDFSNFDLNSGGRQEYVNTVWNNQGNILKAKILLSTDLNQEERSHYIIADFTRILGFFYASDKYPDSIFNTNNNKTDLIEIDKLMIRILYSHDISSGMSKNDVEKILNHSIY